MRVGINLTNSLDAKLAILKQSQNLSHLAKIGHGIEREALRISADGQLADTPHPSALGSSLTHQYITTDYAESLLEFITPVSFSAETAIAQLKDIQKFAFDNMQGERIWPLSMPCYVGDENKVQLAQYGKSNIGRMKTVYRQGLKNRYGTMMQLIAGIHFNFSFSIEFWQQLHKASNSRLSEQDFISEGYFALIRNFKKYAWIIPYLFGASSVICPSFLQGKQHTLNFEKTDSGMLYLPYATSLRMSDLGYTNSAQSKLNICYNSLNSYVKSVQNAMQLRSEEYADLGVKVNGEYQQLNSNILQIENELYAPIRAKRVTKSGEKPSSALASRGVEYVELRALDVNPFIDTGINEQQIYFLDVFLTFCALQPAEKITPESKQQHTNNLQKVILEGRDPKLMLSRGKESIPFTLWATELFAQLNKVAQYYDTANNHNLFSNAVNCEFEKVKNADLTPSAMLLNAALTHNAALSGVQLAEQYWQQSQNYHYQKLTYEQLKQESVNSIEKQQQIENSDVINFEQFLDEYFRDNLKNI